MHIIEDMKNSRHTESGAAYNLPIGFKSQQEQKMREERALR